MNMAAKRKYEHPIYIRNRRNIAILGGGILYPVRFVLSSLHLVQITLQI